MKGLFAAALLATGASPPPSYPPAPVPLVQLLRAKDQALLDAIAPGDRSIWDKALSPDAVYVDENGAVLPRLAFLQALQPLPPGASGHLDIVDYQVVLNGDTALVIHKDDERETYHRVALHAGYLTTETWLHRGGDWKLALVTPTSSPSIRRRSNCRSRP